MLTFSTGPRTSVVYQVVYQSSGQIDVCGFIKPPGSEAECHIRMHGAFKIPYDALGIRCTDQSGHHEVWVPVRHPKNR